MDTAANKQLLHDIFRELAEGNSRPFVDAMADNARWTVAGSSAWARTFEGKQSILNDLLRPLGAQFDGPYRAIAKRILADGDFVVVEARGDAATKAGKRYDNQYCFVYRLAGGKIVEITEYLDTELVTATLTTTPATAARIFNPEGLSTPRGYSHVAEIQGGRIVQIAGQVPLDASGALVGKDDVRAQAGQVFANLKTAVESAGGTFTDIVKLNYYCVDRVSPELISAVREVRDGFVNVNRPPVSTFVFVSRLVAPEWLIEVEATAVIRRS